MNNISNSNKKLVFNIFLIGLIHAMKENRITYDQAHALVFSPGGLERLKENTNLNDYYNVVEQAMGLEDHLSLLGREEYNKEIRAIELEILNKLALGNFESLHEASEFLTSI